MDTDDIYLNTAEQILTFGADKQDRTGTGTRSLFGQQMAFDISAYKLPLLTTKELKLRSIIHELIWFLRGEGNIAYLKENKVGIWDEWSDENGDLGPVYGVQWRHWQDTRVIHVDDWPRYEERGFEEVFMDRTIGMMAIQREIDQIADLLNQLRTTPDSRRMILTAWNPSVIEEQALPPCHSFVQFYTRELTNLERSGIARQRVMNLKAFGVRPLTDAEEELFASDHMESDLDGIPDALLDQVVPATRGLFCYLYQRSGDFFLGVPFNIASYSLLTHMIAKCVGMEPVEFVHTIGDAHFYSNHMEQIGEQLRRKHIDCEPFVVLRGDYDDPGQFQFEDIEVVGYESHPFIKAPVAV